MRVFNSKCRVIANRTSGWRKFPIQQLDWLQVTKEIKRKQSMYLFCILKGLCKDFITQIQQAREQDFLLPNLRFCLIVVLHLGSRGYLRFLFLNV